MYERTISEAEYILTHQSTVRETAKHFNISKSTLHTDISERLKHIDETLYEEVHKIMAYHFSIRHLRGGEATKKKYLR
ncbi:MAG: sporulation transcriptional regulator SpoIIID [Clostridia bacterium]